MESNAELLRSLDGVDMTVRFWGTRGGLPVSGPQVVRYGGDTSCVELRCGAHVVILDAGSGLRRLGEALVRERRAVAADLLLSHTHLDHILGLGFFPPLYQSAATIRVYAGHMPAVALERCIMAMLTPPLAPDLLGGTRAQLDIRAFAVGEALHLHPGLRVATAPLRHPGGSTGYRICWGGKVVAYVTDTEHEPETLDANVLALARDADILIYDANCTEEEFAARRGWGHSTWQEAIRLADAADVGRLVLFHHDRARTDAELDALAASASARPGTIVAADGLILRL